MWRLKLVSSDRRRRTPLRVGGVFWLDEQKWKWNEWLECLKGSLTSRLADRRILGLGAVGSQRSVRTSTWLFQRNFSMSVFHATRPLWRLLFSGLSLLLWLLDSFVLSNNLIYGSEMAVLAVNCSCHTAETWARNWKHVAACSWFICAYFYYYCSAWVEVRLRSVLNPCSSIRSWNLQ